MTDTSRHRRVVAPKVFRPSRNSLCLCGSGRKFKRCCEARYSERATGDRARAALERKDYQEALRECRADITQYTIWHKSHTEPAVQAGFAGIEPLLDIDIKALAELVDLLFWCYIKTDQVDEFPATLERLRANINDPRWQRKIIYFHALHALRPNWNEHAARKELSKLGSVEDDKDVEILQLYLDLFRGNLSFSEKQVLVDRILDLTENVVDRLHYRSARAVEYLLICDEHKAVDELSNAISDFRAAKTREEMSSYEGHRLAKSLDLLGVIRRDEKLVNEAVELYKQLLEKNDWTSTGRGGLYCELGNAYRYNEEWDLAQSMYLKALDIKPSAICKVFLSECLLHQNETEEATRLITELKPGDFDPNEYADYVFAFSAISVEAENPKMLETACAMLRKLEVPGPYFQGQRDSLLFNIIETQRSGTSQTIIHRSRRMLTGLARSAISYLVLQPNFMGIGVNFNKVLEDLTRGEEEHASRSPNKRAKSDA